MSSVSHFTVPAEHPAFAGHFPGSPILPGVVLLDWALQAICDGSGYVLHNCTINSLKFLSPAQAGDVLTIAYRRQDNGAVHFDISTAAHKIASGSVLINASL